MSRDASRRLDADRSAAAAVEFGIVAPVLIFILLATIEVVNAFRVQAKLNLAAGQLAEMIANQGTVTTSASDGPGGTLGDLCTAASYNLLPFSRTPLSAYIESTTVVNGSNGTQTSQDWTSDHACPSSIPVGSFNETVLLTNIADTPRSLFTLDGTPRASGGTLTVGYTAISLQLTYIYTNILPFSLGPSITMTAYATSRPRANTPVICTYPSSSGPANCPGYY